MLRKNEVVCLFLRKYSTLAKSLSYSDFFFYYRCSHLFFPSVSEPVEEISLLSYSLESSGW